MPIMHPGPADANPRAISTRIRSIHSVATSGQRRHNLRLGPQPAYVDAARTPLNRVLVPDLTGGAMRWICDQRREASGRVRQRKVSDRAAVSVAGIITFGKEAQIWVGSLPDKAQDQMFRAVAEAIARHLNTSLHGLVVHLDETAIHAHYQLAAVNHHGAPVSKSTTKQVLNQLQDLAAEVARNFDPRIERGNRKTDRLAAGARLSDVMNRSVKQLHQDLPHEIRARQDELSAVNEALSAAQAAQKQAREKARKNEELAAKARKMADDETERGRKAAKNVKLYDARAEKARAEAAELERRIGVLKEKVLLPAPEPPVIPTPPFSLAARERRQWADQASGQVAAIVLEANERAHGAQIEAQEERQRADKAWSEAQDRMNSLRGQMTLVARTRAELSWKEDELEQKERLLEKREAKLEKAEAQISALAGEVQEGRRAMARLKAVEETRPLPVMMDELPGDFLELAMKHALPHWAETKRIGQDGWQLMSVQGKALQGRGAANWLAHLIGDVLRALYMLAQKFGWDRVGASVNQQEGAGNRKLTAPEGFRGPRRGP